MALEGEMIDAVPLFRAFRHTSHSLNPQSLAR